MDLLQPCGRHRTQGCQYYCLSLCPRRVRQHGAGQAAGYHQAAGTALCGAGLLWRQERPRHREGGCPGLRRVPQACGLSLFRLPENGLTIDQQNRNPSRLSRMPGILRGDKRQVLLETNIGKSCWDEWRDWLEAETDELPETESLADDWESLPRWPMPSSPGAAQGPQDAAGRPQQGGQELCPHRTVHRHRRRQAVAGPVLLRTGQGTVHQSGAGPGLLPAPLQGRVHRPWPAPQNLRNIDIWNLRGASVPMDKLAPKLIRRAQRKGYTAVILDPIYKVITGDENSADQMAKFCNQFDLVCRALDCAVIYCHHHSKGAQGGKRSMDRASGSGVFARDPDAMLDMTELVPTDAIREQLHNKAACRVIKAMLDKRGHADAYGLE